MTSRLRTTMADAYAAVMLRMAEYAKPSTKRDLIEALAYTAGYMVANTPGVDAGEFTARFQEALAEHNVSRGNEEPPTPGGEGGESQGHIAPDGAERSTA